MSDEQKRKLAALQTSYLETMDKVRKAETDTERDSAIFAHVERVMAEPDRDVENAFTIWAMLHAGIGEATIARLGGHETKESFTEH